MTYTRKQAVTCISVVYLIIATALAGYASSRASRFSVPISDTLTGFATALPLVSGILLECGYDLTRRKERRGRMPRGAIERPPLVIVANTIIFIYSTVVITLLGTHAAPPSGLDCGLRQRWQSLFRIKDSKSIRAIQDTFSCCGFSNPRDMAWPFQDKSHAATACQEAFGRNTGCVSAWKAEEQQVAGLLMAVVGMIVLWAFTIIAVPTQSDSWLHQVVPERVSNLIADEEHGSGRPAIDYLPDFNRYSDRVEDATEREDEDAAIRAAERSHLPVGNGLPGNLSLDQQGTVENEWARR